MTTTTSRATRDRAVGIIRRHGATEVQAEAIVRDMSAVGIHLVEVEPPAEPYTGEKAAAMTPEYQQARAAMKGTSE